MANERIILGIDPGTTIMGFGLIKVVNKKMEFLIWHGLAKKDITTSFSSCMLYVVGKLKFHFKLLTGA